MTKAVARLWVGLLVLGLGAGCLPSRWVERLPVPTRDDAPVVNVTEPYLSCAAGRAMALAAEADAPVQDETAAMIVAMALGSCPEERAAWELAVVAAADDPTAVSALIEQSREALRVPLLRMALEAPSAARAPTVDAP